MKRILFVDDESNILDGIRRTFRNDRSQWEMEFALSAEDALHAFEMKNFDVVVSDLRMPGMDGATLLGIIKERYPGTARIVLSGYSEELLAFRALSVAHRCLSKPCDPTELHEAIERACVLQGILGAIEIRRIVGTVSELPSPSTTYTRLIKVMQRPGTSIQDVTNLIETDVAMSAKILQIANSAFFALSRRVASLEQAAMCLGLATIKNLVLATEAFRVYIPHTSVPSDAYESVQRHSRISALIVRALPVPSDLRDISVIAALLHDIGRLFLASAMPEEFCAIHAQNSKHDSELFEVEEQRLGSSHAEIGAYLLGLWGIPFPAVEAIAHHHRPTRLTRSSIGNFQKLDVVDAVYCADLLAHELELHPDDDQGNELRDHDRMCLEERGLLTLYPAFREAAAMTVAEATQRGFANEVQ